MDALATLNDGTCEGAAHESADGDETGTVHCEEVMSILVEKDQMVVFFVLCSEFADRCGHKTFHENFLLRWTRTVYIPHWGYAFYKPHSYIEIGLASHIPVEIADRLETASRLRAKRGW